MSDADQAEKRKRPIANRWVIAVVCIALFSSLGVMVWRAIPKSQTFYTDADTIRTPADDARLRDILWQPPVKLSEFINTADNNFEPRLSWDGLTMYFVRGKAGENADIHTSTRTPEGWSEPQPFDAVNSSYDDLGPEPNADGSAVYFYSNRPGGRGGYDLWMVQRSEKGWRSAVNLGALVNSEFNDYGPALTRDGRTLYFASNRPLPVDTKQPDPDAWPATLREDLFHRTYDLYQAPLDDGGFGQAMPIAALNTPYNEGAPCVTPFGDFVYFSSDRPGGQGGFDLYRGRRLGGELETPTNLGATVNTDANELDPGMTLGGYGLYFSSDRPRQRVVPEKPNDYKLYHSTSREVFRDVEWPQRAGVDWAALWSQLWPNLLWLLLALALLLPLLFLLRMARDKRLGLLARCLLLSLLLHSLLLLLLSLWGVTASVASALRQRGEIQIALTPPAAGDSIAMQIRGELTEVEMPQMPDVAVEQRETPLDVRLNETQMAVLTVEHVDLPVEQQPVEIVVADAPTRELETPEPTEITPQDSQPPSIDVLVPQESQQMRIPEPQRLATEIPDRAPVSDRAEILYAASQPAEPLREIHLDPHADVAGLDADAAKSLVDSIQATDAQPKIENMMPAEQSPPKLAHARRADTLDVSLPAEAARSAQSEARSPPFMLAAVRPARRAFSIQAESQTVHKRVETSPEAKPMNDIPPDSLAVDRTPARDSSPDVTLREIPRVAMAERQSTAARLSLPKVEESFQAPAGEPDPVFNADVARVPTESLRPETATMSDSRTVPLVALKPRSARIDPVARSLADVRDPLRDMLRDAVRLNVLLATPDLTRGRLPQSDSLRSGLRLPNETDLPQNRYSQRAPEQRQSILQRMGGSDETERAVALALSWLARHQSPDGRWDADGFDAGCGHCGGQSDLDVDAALTGLSLLCFLGADHTHTRTGPYQETVRRGIQWLLARQERNGDLRDGESMYSQGIAAIALSEAFGMTHDFDLADPVRRATRFIVRARNRRTGGWRYEPGAPNGGGDTSILGWQVMALKSARLAGIQVPEAAFMGARKWLKSVGSRNVPGLYAYRPNEKPRPAMTAEGMFVQQLLGVSRDDPRMQNSAAYVSRFPPDWDAVEGPNTYFWYYATLALQQHQGEYWTRWNDVLTRELLENQRDAGRSDPSRDRERAVDPSRDRRGALAAGAAGSWDPDDDEWGKIAGRVYQTALCTLMLEVYYRYLPLHSLDKPAEAIGTIRGRIRDAESGQPLADARVRLELPNRPALMVTTDDEGQYVLFVPEVPDYFALSASREGYVPDAVNVPAERLRGNTLEVDFNLEPASRAVVPIEAIPEVHHLGNDRFEGRINSQFQRNSEGVTIVFAFQITAEQMSIADDVAALRMMCKGVQCPHEVEINGVEIDARIDRAPRDGSFGEITLYFEAGLLAPGRNTILIRDVDCRGDLDDFEFVNLRLDLAP